MSKARTVTVSILDKDYQVACPPEQEAELIVSASYLDKQMRLIRETGKVIGLERIAVMAALNISHELLQASEPEQIAGEATASGEPVDDNEVSALSRKIDEAIFSLRQMEIG
ncbi:MAG: cell division protein ZapA [Pseudomonadota bacterium]